MIIARFGATWAGAVVLPNGLMDDDYGTDRPALTAVAGGLDGEFDYHGSDANPIAPVRVKKTAIVTAMTWAGVETALDTLRTALTTGEESYLWGLCRDGSHRWAYAKCEVFDDADKVGQVLHCPVTIEFLLTEGVWYSETRHTLSLADADSDTLTNAGNIPATVYAETSGGAAITATSLTNSTNGSGYTLDTSAGGTYALDIDPAAYAVVVHGGSTDQFDLLTPNVPGRLWLTLDPGDNTLVAASTGGTSDGWDLAWYDTWVM